MRLVLHPDRSRWADVLKRPYRFSKEMMEVVVPVFEAVRARGDEALRDYTLQFDGVRIEDLQVPEPELASSEARVGSEVRSAIRAAAANIERFHRSQVVEEPEVETVPGVRCWRRSLPIRSVGLYVPGGSAPLLSTVLMLGIPARIAGCPEIQLCTPPGADGRVDAAILYAAHVTGIDVVYSVGGAQAIAALTYGTDSIRPADKLLGPGNRFVTAAKQYASTLGVAIDMPAGPTEVAIVADESCPVEFVVLDILAQAEHGPDSHAVLVTTSARYGRAVIAMLESAVQSIPRSEIAALALRNAVCVVVADRDEAMCVCNAYAPEHLILATSDAHRLADKVAAAGSVFVGVHTPESAGDYASGTNHTLPTGGAARAYSGVSVDSFVNKVTFQELSGEGLRRLGPTIETLARAEGLEAHRRSVVVRREAIES